MVDLRLGDCLDVLKTLPAASVDAVITDPPFLLGAASARKSADKPVGWADINNASVWYAQWMREAWRLLNADGSLWVFANWRSLPVLQCAASKIGGLSILSVVVWDKQWPGVGSMRGLRQNYEIIVLFGKPGFAIEDRGLSDIWPCKWTSQRPNGHPQEKPISLVKKIIEVSGLRPGAMIADLFVGSGTTAAACIEAGINFVGCELDENSYDIARRRIESAQLEAAS